VIRVYDDAGNLIETVSKLAISKSGKCLIGIAINVEWHAKVTRPLPFPYSVQRQSLRFYRHENIKRFYGRF
jgi:hypothetical protein